MSMLEKLNGLIKVQIELRKQFQTQAQESFKEVVREFFDANKGVNLITWTQYTPYFNDGEECTFSVYDACFSNADSTEDFSHGEYDGDDETLWSVSRLSGYLQGTKSWNKDTQNKILKTDGLNLQSIKEFEATLSSPEMEEVFEAMFGDHCEVVITRKGIEVNEYSHD